MQQRAIVPALLSVLVLGIVVLAVHTWHNAERVLHPPRVAITPADRVRAQAELPGVEQVTLVTRDGLHLSGWFRAGTRRDAVILVHGLGNNRASLAGVAGLLASSGHGVLLYDSRGSGESEGTLATWGDRERLDLESAIDYALALPEVRADRIGVYGFSVGATAAALVAAADERVHAVVLGPTWTSLDDELRNKFGKWGLLSLVPARLAFQSEQIAIDKLRPIDAIVSIPPRPLFMLSGDRDTDTPPAVMRELQRRVPNVEYWVVPGAGHGRYEEVAPVEFRRRFCGFFDRVFPPVAAVPGHSGSM
jgi:dipeptidyl aminopeptidase/acylaminoacyl peptidase